jgi:ribonuclease III
VALYGALGSHFLAGAMSGRKKSPASLEKKIGHRFKDKRLLTEALTHVSAIGGGKYKASYQRFEFLGDHVLGLAVADLLLREFPNAQEGELSQRLSDLVRKETCAEVGVALDLGAYIYFGRHELQSGGRKKKTIIADVCEAVIGAVYLDGGLAAAERFIHQYWRARALAPGRELRDAKTRLQEWAQKRGLPPPSYRQVERKGPDHRPMFRVAVDVEGSPWGEGEGATKRDAQRAAAAVALAARGIKLDE